MQSGFSWGTARGALWPDCYTNTSVKNVPRLNVEGVLAIASPMQGGKPSTVAYGSRNGYKNVKPTINGFVEDVTAGIDAELTETLLEEIGDALSIDRFWAEKGILISSQVLVGKFLGFRDGLLEAKEDNIRKSLHSMAVNKEAKSAIGPDGELIKKINSYQSPDNYRALLGAERTPVGPRVASGASIEPRRRNFSLFSPPTDRRLTRSVGRGTYGFVTIISDGVQVEPGHEPATVLFFKDLKYWYKASADYYRKSCYNPFNAIGCISSDLWKHRAWKKGRRALQNFGSTYTKIINAYRLDRSSRTRQVCRDPNSGRVVGRVNEGKGSFKPPRAEEHISGYIDPEEDCWQERETYYVSVPNKTDGLLGTSTNTWNPPQEGEGPNLGPHSILYNDRPSSNQYKQGGTGYNHAEMVYNRRRYSASEDPGISNGEFSKGERNPPMVNGEDWAFDALGGPNYYFFLEIKH